MIRLNLLSGKEKEQIKKDILAVEVTNGIILVFSIIALTAMVLGVSQKYLEYKVDSITKYASSAEETKIAEINKKMGQLAELQKDYTKWSIFFKNIIELVPNTIKLNSLQLDKDSQKITMVGFAQSRDDYLKLEENLKQSELISEVKAPVSNLLRQNNLDFSIEATMKMEN
jgi:Tfp pilus assembly protein PilN